MWFRRRNSEHFCFFFFFWKATASATLFTENGLSMCKQHRNVAGELHRLSSGDLRLAQSSHLLQPRRRLFKARRSQAAVAGLEIVGSLRATRSGSTGRRFRVQAGRSGGHASRRRAHLRRKARATPALVGQTSSQRRHRFRDQVAGISKSPPETRDLQHRPVPLLSQSSEMF